MQGNAWPCVALRGELLQMWLLAQNPGEPFVRRLIGTLLVIALPPFEFGPRPIPRCLPDVLSCDPLFFLAKYFLDVRIHRRAPVHGTIVDMVRRGYRCGWL